jgi:hypothetical protein
MHTAVLYMVPSPVHHSCTIQYLGTSLEGTSTCTIVLKYPDTVRTGDAGVNIRFPLCRLNVPLHVHWIHLLSYYVLNLVQGRAARKGDLRKRGLL